MSKNTHNNSKNNNKNKTSSNKIIVFDLDETMGFFTQMGTFWDTIRILNSNAYNTMNKHIPQPTFQETLDLFPEFLRPNILNILHYIIECKKKGLCKDVMIYTNNQGPSVWVDMIKKYFNIKMDYPIITNIVRAFKVNNKKVELCRTSHEKKFDDFINCTKLPNDVELCFIDDTKHNGMVHDQVYYINILPYRYFLPIDSMIERYITLVKTKYHEKYIKDIQDSKSDKRFVVLDRLSKYNSFIISFGESTYNKYNLHYVRKTPNDYKIDQIIGKRLYHMIEDFIENE